MAQLPEINDLQSALLALSHDLQRATIAWQVGAIALALALAWALTLWLKPKLDRVEGRWKSSVVGLERILFSACGCSPACCARRSIRHPRSTPGSGWSDGPHGPASRCT